MARKYFELRKPFKVDDFCLVLTPIPTGVVKIEVVRNFGFSLSFLTIKREKKTMLRNYFSFSFENDFGFGDFGLC